MEVRLGVVDRRPGYKMGLSCLVTAFVEVGEELFRSFSAVQKLEWNSKLQGPFALAGVNLCMREA